MILTPVTNTPPPPCPAPPTSPGLITYRLELARHHPYNVKVDIYSWAILSWEMLAIEKPYAWATQTSFYKVSAGGKSASLPNGASANGVFECKKHCDCLPKGDR